MNHLLEKWGGKVVAGSRSRWITLLLWVITVSFLSFLWPQVNEEETNSNNLLPDDAMSVEASKIMEEQFANDTGTPLLLVWYRENGLNEADFQLIQNLYQELNTNPLQQQSMVPDFSQVPVQGLKQTASEDSKVITTPVFFSENAAGTEINPSLKALKTKITELAEEDPFNNALSESGLHIRLSGPVGIQNDAEALFGQADLTLLLATVLLVLVLLILLYRSPILAIVPLIGGRLCLFIR